MTNVNNLARRLNELERQVADLSAPRLAFSSIEDGAIAEYDSEGRLRGLLGKQWDGTFAVAAFNGPPPPQPTVPIVEPHMGGLKVRWDGAFEGGAFAPMDFSRVEVHVSLTADFEPNPSTLRGTIESPQGGELIVPLPYQEHTVRLVARSLSGTASTPSTAAKGTPGRVMKDDLADGAVDAAKIADFALTAKKFNVRQHILY